ncbi:nucleotidyltransferase family protein [Micromonospora avicenniae]|uniref:nucleotidyltransferase family protein n=1 Tax=Micromonospora avicenniae TaxID=1198245 RepID=UPI0034188C46
MTSTPSSSTSDLSRDNDRATRRLAAAWREPPWEAKNQAAAHTWYPAKFGGGPVAPLRTIAHAVATWPEYATAVAARLDAYDQIAVCAPHGLDDLLDGVWRRNRTGSARRSPSSGSPAIASPNAGPASAS